MINISDKEVICAWAICWCVALSAAVVLLWFFADKLLGLAE